MDITQGNILEPSKIAKVKVGMTKSQVYYLLGTPVLPTAFHDDRWDYVYYNDVLRKELELYRLTLLFDGERIEYLRKTENLVIDKS
ncbi:MAG: outer membrane protein assembly factor BamE [Chromatiales bacterium]|nr:outer membrane protein assembly factor BamE [Chromatiales bacterium]